MTHKTSLASLRVALVHDWLTEYAGSERVLAALSDLVPDAPIYTLIHDRERFAGTALTHRDIRGSFLDRLPLSRKYRRALLPLMPLAVEQFDLTGYDVVISSSHAVAKGIITSPAQLHISYIHSPIRYGWDFHGKYLTSGGLRRSEQGIAARLALHYIRLWDVAATNRVDAIMTNSRYVGERLRKTYRRRARVIYPPVDAHRFQANADREDFYLWVGRLAPYKRVDLVVAACSELGLPLVVVGDGPDRRRIEELAGPTVRVVGYQPDAVVLDLMQRCRAFITAEEDFGIATVEAQAAGAPVVAFAGGGAAEIVRDGETGVLFEAQSLSCLAEAIMVFNKWSSRFDPMRIRENADRFLKERFHREVDEFVREQWATHTARSLSRRS